MHSTRLVLHLTAMWYATDSERPSGSESEHKYEEFNDDSADGELNNHDNDSSDSDDGAQSNTSYGENLRVQGISSLEHLTFNDE